MLQECTQALATRFLGTKMPFRLHTGMGAGRGGGGSRVVTAAYCPLKNVSLSLFPALLPQCRRRLRSTCPRRPWSTPCSASRPASKTASSTMTKDGESAAPPSLSRKGIICQMMCSRCLSICSCLFFFPHFVPETNQEPL